MKKTCILILFIVFSNIVSSQNNGINQYKYVIVKSKFNFVKQVDGYQTSSLTKFLFNKAGYIAYLDNEEIPQELAANRCLAIFATVTDNSGMLTTKSAIELSDCRGKLIFKSENGTSRLKAYIKAYRTSIRQAFSYVEKLNYVYDPSVKQKPIVDIKVPVTIPIKKPLQVTKEVIVKEKEKAVFPLLYAKDNEAGYQLTDTKLVVVFVLLKTNTANKFIIKDKNGTLVNKGNYWLAEYYKDGNLVTEKYQIKF